MESRIKKLQETKRVIERHLKLVTDELEELISADGHAETEGFKEHFGKDIHGEHNNS
jgi:hypothetical protein